MKFRNPLKPQVIRNCTGDPYLVRWRLVWTRWFSLYLHHILRSDEDRDLTEEMSVKLQGAFVKVAPSCRSENTSGGRQRSTRRSEKCTPKGRPLDAFRGKSGSLTTRLQMLSTRWGCTRMARTAWRSCGSLMMTLGVLDADRLSDGRSSSTRASGTGQPPSATTATRSGKRNTETIGLTDILRIEWQTFGTRLSGRKGRVPFRSQRKMLSPYTEAKAVGASTLMPRSTAAAERDTVPTDSRSIVLSQGSDISPTTSYFVASEQTSSRTISPSMKCEGGCQTGSVDSNGTSETPSQPRHEVFHDHPWSFLTLILAGGYREHTPRGVTFHGPGELLHRPTPWLHRLELDRPAWTLVFVGPRKRRWGFQTVTGWVHWKDFLRAKGCGETDGQP